MRTSSGTEPRMKYGVTASRATVQNSATTRAADIDVDRDRWVPAHELA